MRNGITKDPSSLVTTLSLWMCGKLTVEIELGDGRERIFIFHKFGEALERMARPLLHDQRTASVGRWIRCAFISRVA